MKPKVSVVKCPDYKTENIESAVKKSVDLLGGIEKFVKPGMKVLIKPNLLSPRNPDRGKTTHPETVRAVIRLVKKAGGIPSVGDSPGGNVVHTDRGKTLANIAKYWVETGMKKVCDEEKAELVCFEAGGTEKFTLSNRKYTPEIFIAKVPLSCDLLINVPKLKTHGMVLYTGAIKNLYGCVPGVRKTRYHMQAIHPNNFSQLLVDIADIVKPKLTIIDAVVGMDGQGPSAGRLVNIGAILAGEDMVAVDSVGSKILGFKHNEVPAVKIANKQGLGESDLAKIELLGDRLDDVIIKNPIKPSNVMLKSVPQFMANILGKLIWVHPRINNEKCRVCKVCVENCPAKTIIMNGKFPKVDKRGCISCMCCHELCNYEAIDIEMSKLASKLIH